MLQQICNTQGLFISNCKAKYNHEMLLMQSWNMQTRTAEKYHLYKTGNFKSTLNFIKCEFSKHLEF